MSQDLIVVGFKGTQRASEVLSELQKLEDNWVVELKDAVSAYRTDDGQLRIDKSVQSTPSQAADLGVVVGGLLGALLAVPLTGGLSAAAAAGTIAAGAAGVGLAGAKASADDAADFKRRYGISDEFVDKVGKLINPGESAAFVLLRTADPDIVMDRFRGYGGQILRTNLSIKEAARVQRELRG